LKKNALRIKWSRAMPVSLQIAGGDAGAALFGATRDLLFAKG
jgi:hypothetical protein